MDPKGAGRHYRVAEPLNAMGRRGHELVTVEAKNGRLDIGPLERCDVVHIYRCLEPIALQVVSHLAGRGIAVVWDNDDDYSVPLPELSPGLEAKSSAERAKVFSLSVEIARAADRVTTTTQTLAQRYLDAGVERVEVIANTAVGGERPRLAHDGLVIGWVAGWEHWADAQRLGISDALQRVMDAHPRVRVECIGAELELNERYRHDRVVPFYELLERMGSFDIGIAPLADLPFNHARSDIKVKEYAASGVPWLASDLTPYAHLGPEQGGRLVSADGWFVALDRLVRDDPGRRALADDARRWGIGQTIEATADRWEQVFREAAAAVGRPRAVTPPTIRIPTTATGNGPVRLKIRRPGPSR